MIISYTIKTEIDYEDGSISQKVFDVKGDITKLREKELKRALLKLDWSPPNKKGESFRFSKFDPTPAENKQRDGLYKLVRMTDGIRLPEGAIALGLSDGIYALTPYQPPKEGE